MSNTKDTKEVTKDDGWGESKLTIQRVDGGFLLTEEMLKWLIESSEFSEMKTIFEWFKVVTNKNKFVFKDGQGRIEWKME